MQFFSSKIEDIPSRSSCYDFRYFHMQKKVALTVGITLSWNWKFHREIHRERERQDSKVPKEITSWFVFPIHALHGERSRALFPQSEKEAPTLFRSGQSASSVIPSPFPFRRRDTSDTRTHGRSKKTGRFINGSSTRTCERARVLRRRCIPSLVPVWTTVMHTRYIYTGSANAGKKDRTRGRGMRQRRRDKDGRILYLICALGRRTISYLVLVCRHRQDTRKPRRDY